jgi:coenzyme F420-0:L-glutamate ligase/coenzyme F420-1:gamma-L-glutamate ligase
MSGFRVWAVEGIPEVVAGDDLPAIVADAVGELEEGDILVVTSKVVSKAEGRQVVAADREDAITAETVRVVATKAHAGGVTRIVENRLGLVLAAAGVDSSNAPEGTILLLPVDPDASARAICVALRERFGVRVGVVVSDTLGRAWRLGQTDIAIGAAGLRVLDDLRGSTDAGGRRLEATIIAVADELAGAADLVKGKAAGLPVAVIRGLGHLVGDLDGPGARAIVRPAEEDLFRLGADEAYAEGLRDGQVASPREPSL